MNISLRQLRAFVAVAKTGSFTAAGRELHLTQSTLTKTIRELESEVHLQFFERTTRRVQLTSDGSAFLPVAKRLLQDFDLSLEDLREHASGHSGTVRVACGTAFATTVLPKAVSRFRSSHPGVLMHVLDDTSGGVVRRVATGEVDFGFGSMVGAGAKALSARRLLTARLGVLFPPPRFGTLPGKVTLASLHALPLLRDNPDTSIATVLHERGVYFPQQGQETVEVSNLAVQFAMVRAGVGACVLSALAASHPSAKGLPFRLIQSPTVSRDIYLFSRRERVLSPAAEAFMQVLDAVLPTLDLHPGVSISQ